MSLLCFCSVLKVCYCKLFMHAAAAVKLIIENEFYKSFISKETERKKVSCTVSQLSLLPDSYKNYWSVKYFTLQGMCSAGLAIHIPVFRCVPEVNLPTPTLPETINHGVQPTAGRRNHMYTKSFKFYRKTRLSNTIVLVCTAKQKSTSPPFLATIFYCPHQKEQSTSWKACKHLWLKGNALHNPFCLVKRNSSKQFATGSFLFLLQQRNRDRLEDWKMLSG